MVKLHININRYFNMTKNDRINFEKLKFKNIIYKEFISIMKQKIDINDSYYEELYVSLNNKFKQTNYKITNKEAFIQMLKKEI